MNQYRMSQACYLMVNKEPPPDEMEEKDIFASSGSRKHHISIIKRELKPKPMPWDVDRFLKQFLNAIAENRFPEINEKLKKQEVIHKEGALTHDKSIVNIFQKIQWIHKKMAAEPVEPVSPNHFYDTLLSAEDLTAIAKNFNLRPAFLAPFNKDPLENNDNQVKIPTPKGTSWNQIKLRIVNADRIEITHPGGMQPYRSRDLGLSEKRILWPLVEQFAKHQGELKPDESAPLKANVSNLRVFFQSLFPDINGSPIKKYSAKNGYVCNFQIEHALK